MPTALVLGVGRAHRHGAEGRLLVLDDFDHRCAALEQAPETARNDHRDRAPEAFQRTEVEVIVVGVRDEHRIETA